MTESQAWRKVAERLDAARGTPFYSNHASICAVVFDVACGDRRLLSRMEQRIDRYAHYYYDTNSVGGGLDCCGFDAGAYVLAALYLSLESKK
jgi:hypothetical protein